MASVFRHVTGSRKKSHDNAGTKNRLKDSKTDTSLTKTPFPKQNTLTSKDPNSNV